MTDIRNKLAETLRDRVEEIEHLRVVAGFDGFVDELIEIVEERTTTTDYTPVPTISRFAELIGAAAGRSSLREMIVKSVDAGGCAVNLGDAIANLGARLDYFGTLGESRNPAFEAFASLCESCHSLGVDPGHTLALEFEDGKTMLSSMNQLAEFTPELLKEKLADGKLADACAEASLIAITNWTLYPHMTDCWSWLQRELFAGQLHHPWYFIDLVDPRSRSKDDIRDMLEVLPGFEKAGRCILGGNLNEANVLSGILGLPEVNREGPGLVEQCGALREKLDITEVVIHSLHGAAVAAEDGGVWIKGPYTPKPKKSTGAGDRFNAGYCLGRLLNLPPEERCLLGAAGSGFFVRNARSGSLAEVAFLLEDWAAGTLET